MNIYEPDSDGLRICEASLAYRLTPVKLQQDGNWLSSKTDGDGLAST